MHPSHLTYFTQYSVYKMYLCCCRYINIVVIKCIPFCEYSTVYWSLLAMALRLFLAWGYFKPCVYQYLCVETMMQYVRAFVGIYSGMEYCQGSFLLINLDSISVYCSSMKLKVPTEGPAHILSLEDATSLPGFLGNILRGNTCFLVRLLVSPFCVFLLFLQDLGPLSPLGRSLMSTD